MADNDSGLSTALTDSNDSPGTGPQPAGDWISGIGNAPNVPAATSVPAEAPDIGAPSAAPNLSASVGQPAAPDLPRFQRTFGNTLKGMLVGFGLGGIPGMVAGGIDPEAAQTARANKLATAAANQHFASARAAHETAAAAMLEKQVNDWNEQHQAEMEKIGLENLKAAQDAGFSIVSVTPLDGHPADNSKAAMNNLQQIQKANGGSVPEGLLHIHAGNDNGIFTLQLANPGNALPVINQTRMAQGLPAMDSDTFGSLSKQDQAQMAKDAVNFALPTGPNGQITQDSVTTLENRLALVQAQPGFNGKEQMVANLQKNLDFQKSAVQHEAERARQKQTADIASKGAAEAETPQGAATLAQTKASTAKTIAETENVRKQNAAAGNADAFGNVSPLSDKEFNKRYDSFNKSKEYETLKTLTGSYQQFQDTVNDIESGKPLTGAASVVGLFNAIGISATPLAGKGFRINQATVQEHVGARGIDQAAYQKLLKLKQGDVITPQQLKDYANIAVNVYRDAFVNAANEEYRQLGYIDILPQGNNRPIDRVTAGLYLRIAGGDKVKARAAAQKSGWVIQ